MIPRTSIEVIGSKSKLRFEPIVDTGFSGDLCLPLDLIIALGLEVIGKKDAVLADGSVRAQLTFGAVVRFLGGELDIEVNLTDLEEPLIGRRLLEECRLTIDFVNETVEIKKAKRKAPRR